MQIGTQIYRNYIFRIHANILREFNKTINSSFPSYKDSQCFHVSYSVTLKSKSYRTKTNSELLAGLEKFHDLWHFPWHINFLSITSRNFWSRVNSSFLNESENLYRRHVLIETEEIFFNWGQLCKKFYRVIKCH